MKNISNVLIGLLAGLAAGAVLGLLFAPDSGSETRDKLSQSLNDLGESIMDRAAAEVENLSALKEDILGKFIGQAEEIQENRKDSQNASE